VTRALVYLEEKGFTARTEPEEKIADEDQELPWGKEKTEHFARGVIDQAKAIIQEGNVTKIRLISEDKALIEIPATVGVVALGVVLFSPLLFALSAIGAATAVIKEMAFEIERSDGTVERRSLKFPGLGAKTSCCEEEADCCGEEIREDDAGE
jgi:hypothetical protein